MVVMHLTTVKEYIVQGYDMKEQNGRIYLSNNSNTINLNLSIERKIRMHIFP